MKHICWIIALVFVQGLATAQPTWRFHVAFEDATGAKDTIWMVYDTTATVGTTSDPQVDSSLGEAGVDMDLDAFNVWTLNWSEDSTKTIAWPYSQFPFHQVMILGFNHQFPVTIRWDLSLGALPWLPPGGPIDGGMIYNTYFFFFNNCPGCGYFDIHLVDSVVVDDPSPDVLFPLSFTLGHIDDTNVPEVGQNISFYVWPNPASDRILFHGITEDYSAEIYDPRGAVMLTKSWTDYHEGLSIAHLTPGIYATRITTRTKKRYHATFIKQD